jgi:large subunit ribosomal protein L33
LAEHVLGKDEVTGSIPVIGSMQATAGPQRREKRIMRDNIALACTECKRRNYVTTKNKKKTTERLQLKKFCSWCRCHTPHRESK